MTDKINLDLDHLALRTKLLEDFYFFVRYGFKQQTGMKWSRNWHHLLMCKKLEDVFNGKCTRLVVNIPPRYSKTEIVVKYFIAWCLAKQPDCEFIHASYSARLAAGNTSYARDIVTSEWYQSFFTVSLDPSASGKDHWRTISKGVVYASGCYGSITGFGAGKMRPEDFDGVWFGGAVLIDDPHKADEATSDTSRNNVLEWYANTIKSRLNDPLRTPVIVVMQRLHEEDLAGWLLKNGSGEPWEHLFIPALNDNGECDVWPASADTVLWPAKHSREQLEIMQRSNSYVFAGQYLQRPAPLGGGIFKDSWWRYFRYDALPPVKRIVQSWDTAFKTKDHNDPSSCTVWAECENGYYLVHRLNKRMEYPLLKQMMISIAAKKWGGKAASAILVEDTSAGQSLIQDLRQTALPIVPVQVDKDKVTRAFAVTGIVESGRVYLPEGAEWIDEYVTELGSFPSAAHDDDVDSTTQALTYMHLGGGASGFLDYYRSELAA